MNGSELRRIVLERVKRYSNYGSNFQGEVVLLELKEEINPKSIEEEQAILTIWYDLFREGIIAWGYNLGNPDPPFIHLTEVGRRCLEHLSRDPYNPDGYMSMLKPLISDNAIAYSYIKEALEAFQSCCYRAVAVLVGAASESIILDLRDVLISRLKILNEDIPDRLNDWRIKIIRDEIEKVLNMHKKNMPQRLQERYSAFWIPLTDQMRLTRNDAGHPKSIEPVTHDMVHASLLLFPELAGLEKELREWIISSYN